MQQRSIFWPLFLIAAGVTWLLVRSGTVPGENLWALTYIWPFVLIAAGLGIILRSYWQYTSLILDVLIIGGAVLAIVYAPRLGWTSPSMVTMFNNNEPFTGPSERGSGNVVMETREVSGFEAIDVNYPAEVTISQGTAESLKIEAEDNLLPLLKTEVRGGRLEIFYKRGPGKNIRATKPVRITIVVKDLNDVQFSSAGQLTIDRLEADELEVSLSGAGDVQLNQVQAGALYVNMSGAGSATASGSARNLIVNISGLGSFEGGELESQDARVAISGAGGATVWAERDLNVDLSGAGSVSYYGAASVSRNISGVGGVRHLGEK